MEVDKGYIPRLLKCNALENRDEFDEVIYLFVLVVGDILWAAITKLPVKFLCAVGRGLCCCLRGRFEISFLVYICVYLSCGIYVLVLCWLL